MADVKWVKVYTNMFETNRKIKQIELMPEGDTILIIWLKLLLLAGNINDGGAIYLTPEIPYTDEMLANELRRPVATVRMALTLFEQFGMVEITDNILHLSSWEKYQNTDRLAEIREYNRLAQKKSREKRKNKKALPHVNDNVNDMSLTCQRCHDTDIEEDKDLDLDLERKNERKKDHQSFDQSSGDENISEEHQLNRLNGKLGKGVVLLSEAQIADLLEKLSLDEYHKYIEIVADAELNGKHYKRKSHYQAILDMAKADRAVSV